MKKFVSLIMAIALLCGSMLCVAQAEEGIMPYNSNYFSWYGTNLSDRGGGTIKIVFTASGMEPCTEIGVATYQVDKLNDEGQWVNVTGLRNGSTGKNVTTYTFGKYFYGVVGETYRVNVMFICSLNGGMETKSYTSGRITAKKS